MSDERLLSKQECKETMGIGLMDESDRLQLIALRQHIRSFPAGEAEGRKQVVEWFDEPCPHTGGLEEQQMCKGQCPKCWQSLKELVLGGCYE